MQAAIDDLWPYTGEIFEIDQTETDLIAAGIAIDPSSLRTEWDKTIDYVLREATLRRPENGWMQTGGRVGHHSEHLGFILAELQHIQRSYPNAKW